MKTFSHIEKNGLFDIDNVYYSDNDINELDAYIKSKEQYRDKVYIEEGMSLDEISEIASNRIVDLIKEQLSFQSTTKIESVAF